MNLEEFKEFYYDVEIDQEFKKKSLDQYYQNIQKQWSSKPDQQIKTLEKITSFNNSQLKILK